MQNVSQHVIELMTKGSTQIQNGSSRRVEWHLKKLIQFIKQLDQDHPGTKINYEFGKWNGSWSYKITLK